MHLLKNSLMENFIFSVVSHFLCPIIFFIKKFSDIVLYIAIEFMKILKDLKDFDIFNLVKLQEFNKRITELIKNALNQNSNAYLILGKSSFPFNSFMTEVPIIQKPPN